MITGADGFVGRYLVDALKGTYEVIGTTHSARGALNKSRGIYYEFVEITDKKMVDALIHQHLPDVIVHLAAKTDDWFAEPYVMFATNLTGTLNLYESVLRQKQRNGYDPKILYISSSEVYGATQHSKSIKEKNPFFPVHHYATSKASADMASFEYARSKKLNIVILRPFTHTGPRQRLGFFVPDMASQIAKLENKPGRVELFAGELGAVRDYLDVRDVVEAYRLVIENNIPSGIALNVCSGRGVKIKEVLESLLALSTKEIIVKLDQSRLRPSDAPLLVGDNSKLQELTGWRPSINLNDTLERTLHYWRGVETKEIKARE